MNLGFLWWNSWKFELGEQLNFISALLLLYAFAGFVRYGSLESLVKTLKHIVLQKLRKRHIHIWQEIEFLKREKIELIASIAKQKE